MNFTRLSTIFLSFFIIGISVGYVLGYYVGEYSDKKNLFYLSALFMGIGVFLLIYSSLFSIKNGNKKKYNK